MANELTISISLGYSKNNTTVQRTVAGLQINVAGNGLNSLISYSAPTTETAIPLGSVTIPGGWLFLQNNDPTNYVTVRTQVGGQILSVLQPGDPLILPMPTTSPIVIPSTQSNTAPCLMSLAVFDK